MYVFLLSIVYFLSLLHLYCIICIFLVFVLKFCLFLIVYFHLVGDVYLALQDALEVMGVSH